MNKGEREIRKMLQSHPKIKLETDAGGFTLVAPSGKRRRLGSLRGKGDRAMHHAERWCQQHGGTLSPQGGRIK